MFLRKEIQSACLLDLQWWKVTKYIYSSTVLKNILKSTTSQILYFLLHHIYPAVLVTFWIQFIQYDALQMKLLNSIYSC